jgi:hypothetical protein
MLDVHGDIHGVLSCDCAVIDISKELVEKLQRVASFLCMSTYACRDVYSLAVWDFSASYFDSNLVDMLDDGLNKFSERLEEVGYRWLALDHVPCDCKEQRVELCQCVATLNGYGDRSVSDVEFHWTCQPKHTDLELRTSCVSLGLLLQKLQEQGA